MIIFSLYFANSGLQTHLNLLTTGRSWWTLVVLILLASTAKIVPVTLMSKLCSRKPWFYCLSIGVLMNTRGIVQLVVLNIGVELGVISPRLFSIFVLMATILTFLTSPILSILYPKNYDTQKLSVPIVAAELGSIRNSEINVVALNDNNENIATISNGNNGYIQEKRESVKSVTNMHTNEAIVTFDDRVKYMEFDHNLYEEESEDMNNDNTLYRTINMTRF